MLDGFPRNEPQSDALDELLRDLDRELDAILYFDLSDDVATDRHARPRRRGGPHRRHARGDRAPALDLPRETEPVVEHYRVTGKLVPLHADRTADQVWVEIQQALDQVRAGA